MARTYKLQRRAEQQAKTRQKIVEAAVDSHASIGPALTTISMVAERAGVQRHTLYAHFPDERSLFLPARVWRWSATPYRMVTPGVQSRIGASACALAFVRFMVGTSATSI